MIVVDILFVKTTRVIERNQIVKTNGRNIFKVFMLSKQKNVLIQELYVVRDVNGYVPVQSADTETYNN